MLRFFVCITFNALLCNAHFCPIVGLEWISAKGFLSYILSLRHPSHSGSLSKSSYGSKHAALFHLFQVHNGTGMPVEFTNQLTNLFKVFYRLLAKNCPVHAIGEGPGMHHGEGKAPMSTDLYKSICTWLLEYGTAKGLFAYCFLTLMWNLAC